MSGAFNLTVTDLHDKIPGEDALQNICLLYNFRVPYPKNYGFCRPPKLCSDIEHPDILRTSIILHLLELHTYQFLIRSVFLIFSFDELKLVQRLHKHNSLLTHSNVIQSLAQHVYSCPIRHSVITDFYQTDK